MNTLWQDLRYGMRMLRKYPGFTTVVVLTLALGIGINTAIFTLFEVQLRPLQFKDPKTVIRLEYRAGERSNGFSFPDYIFFRNQAQTCSGLIAHTREKFLLRGQAAEEPEEIAGEFVSDNFFSVLGASAIRGRTFTAEENSAAGRDQVVVLSHRLWRRHFAGEPNIVGRTLLLNGKPFVVIGVMPRDFAGLNDVFKPNAPEIWLPLMMREAMPSVYYEEVAAKDRDWFGRRSFQWLNISGRLKPGRTLEEARAEMAVLFGRLARAWPEINSRDSVNVLPAEQFEFEFWQLLVMLATGLVLLIACSNIANLLLARAAARQKEIGVRLCLGASRFRMIRQLLTESLLLAGLGGGAGLLVAWWSVEILARLLEPDFDRLAMSLAPNARVLAFTFLLSLLSGLIFGLAPALRATRPDLVAIIKDDGTTFGQAMARSRLRNGLVVAQVALCLMLLIPAGLLVRSLMRAMKMDLGYETKKVLAVGYSLELSGYDDARAQRFNQELVMRLKALPGVEQVSLGNSPMRRTPRAQVALPGESADKRLDHAFRSEVTPDYFETVGIPIIRGRVFAAEEMRAGADVVMVSESAARNLWPGEDPLGKLLRVERGGAAQATEAVASPLARVIGVARDAQTRQLGEFPAVLVYVPLVQSEWQDLSVLVRTSMDARKMKPSVQALIRSMEPTTRLGLETLEEELADAEWGIRSTRMASQLASALGLLALLLATIGIYGVMAYAVTQRTREIGIRMALGAQTSDVLKLVLRQGMALVLIGAAIGLPVSLALTQLLKSLLYGLSAADPVTLALITLLLAAVALLACYVPARRAMKVDPMVALRYE